MVLRRTIFEHDPPPKSFWVRARVRLSKEVYKDLSLCLTEAWDQSGPMPGAFEITDFRAPSHPEVDWAWLDSHQREVWAAVEFDA